MDSTIQDSEGNPVSADNTYTMTFKEQESGFFAGIAAALTTKSNKVAVVNGIAFPSNVNYEYGFMSGVNYANAKYGTAAEYVELPSYAGTDLGGNDVGGNYVGDFADEATGKVVGEALIEEGCDVIFVAAGASGNGVFTAIKEAEGVYVIGCDVDQYDDGANGDSNIVLTSALKVMHSNVTKQLENIYNGTFVGEDALLGADTDSTGYVSEEGRQQLSEDALYALLGENGAGKSTLMSMLFGMYEPDAGEILIDGKKVVFHSSNDAAALSIGMVHQHFKLVETFTIAENIVLGIEPMTKKFGILPWVDMKTANRRSASCRRSTVWR